MTLISNQFNLKILVFILRQLEVILKQTLEELREGEAWGNELLRVVKADSLN